ncbi:acetyl-CoA carboxylase carboxyl transferase subunit alpha/beta [Streptomyces sp. CA-210063]|uniref:carboxyl transferase domain-containing protein n=1 Tax=Streptomyces sp. CA-210063 TaxID=2801029 RepID=UPI00214CB57C|nr:carboxyl transferase domain-containing protein [Streptomyces sp. CA-210063]UUU34157.1 acetyl-CoA carboxylase carboxyl transferase subunit alpha/beta [Streptomyces sp. CA-210063]
MTDHRRTAREAIALVTDTFTQLPDSAREYEPDGPLAWQGYDASRARAAERTGEGESVVCGRATIRTTEAVLIAFEFGFLGGSLGERTGDRLEAAYTYAREHRLPVVSLIATGGSRMQEGMRALTQLQRVARQSALTRAAGLPQIAVLRDPTTGGGWATLGAGADVVLALPGAQVGFAGSRVRPPDADPTAYTAESQVAAGSVDAVVPPEDLRETLALWLALLTIPSTTPAPPPHALPPHRAPHKGRRPFRGAGLYPSAAPPRGASNHEQPAAATEPLPPPHEAPLPTTGWEAVTRARSPQRPRADAYLDAYFTRRAAISGDRVGGGTDPGMACGFGEHEGRTVAYAAQRGTATRPAGYRTAARLIRLADRLGIPVLTLVDTPGAANDADAERQGAGAAIADLFTAVATARTPVTTLLIGEGGSGGALALAAPDNTWATPDSYFSVIAPELAAAILKRPEERVRATADELGVRPQDLVELGVVRGIKGTYG